MVIYFIEKWNKEMKLDEDTMIDHDAYIQNANILCGLDPQFKLL